MKNYKIYFYSTSNGKEPAKNYLDILPPKLLAKFLRIVDLLESNGPEIGMPYSRYLEQGIFEIRVIQNNNIARVFYFFTKDRKIILTNGFTKKTQRIPQKEIRRAIGYKNDYERSHSYE